MKTPSVLVVDDDAIILDMMTMMLGREGIDTSVMMNGDPLRHKNLNSFDCIMLDIWLSDCYGEESLEILAEQSYQGAVVLVSGTSKEEINRLATKGLKIGLFVAGYLTKPFRKQDLIEILARVPQFRPSLSAPRLPEYGYANASLGTS